MKSKLKSLNLNKKTVKSSQKKKLDVKNVVNINSKEIKINYLDLMSEDVWDYMNEYNDKDLK